MLDTSTTMQQNAHKQELPVYDMDFTVTDSGNAQRLVDRIHKDYKYCEPLRGWFVWSGLHWKLDNDSIWAKAKEFSQEILHEAVAESDRTVADRLWRHGRYSLSEPGLRKMINLASKDDRIRRSPNEFDANPYLLNVLNGTIDLRTGALTEHDKTTLLTKLIDVEYDLEAASPTWDAFLERILPSEDLRRYIQKAVGYSFVGEVSEHLLLICYGTGRNGKGTFMETIRSTARAYVHRTRTEMLMAKRYVSDGPTPDLANLKGKRFVFASESDDGQRLNESQVKDLTGDDTINARHLNKNSMEFSPTHTLWLQTNHRPVIKGSDIGIWSSDRPPFFVPVMIESLGTDSSSLSSSVGTESALCADRAPMAAYWAGVRYPKAPCGLWWL
jgi:putative DNA primase/helicase